MKWFVLDMDGTCLDQNSQMSKIVHDTIYEKIEQGFEFIPCTGRTAKALPVELNDLPYRYVISANGAVITDKNQTIYQSVFTPEEAGKLLDFFKLGNTIVYTHSQGIHLFDNYQIDYFHQLRPDYKPVSEFYDDLSAHLIEKKIVSAKVGVLFIDKEEKKKALQFESQFEYASFFETSDHSIEIVKKGSSKGNALIWLMEKCGVDRNDVLAIGDNGNDVSMLQVAGVGVAMANATDLCKEAADFITTSNQDDGVAYALNIFLK